MVNYKLYAVFGALLCWAQATWSEAPSASLTISVDGGAFNAKFKFYDASRGCPGYNDIPGARDYLGGVFASSKGVSKRLPAGIPLQVFLFRPRDTPGISAGGGASEIRRRALQFVLTDDATLEFTEFADHVPSWEASGGIVVEPASACEQDSESVDEAVGPENPESASDPVGGPDTPDAMSSPAGGDDG